jgi:hypothetical protein
MKMTDVVGLIDEKAAEVATVRRVYKERDAKLQSGHLTVNRPFNCDLMSSSFFVLKPFGKAAALDLSEQAGVAETGRAWRANG